MRKLSQIKGPDAMVVIGSILPIIVKMIRKTGKPENGENSVEFFGKLISANPDEAISLVSVIDGVPEEEYRKKNIIEISSAVLSMTQDDELMELFNSQTLTETSSMSATENSEVKE